MSEAGPGKLELPKSLLAPSGDWGKSEEADGPTEKGIRKAQRYCAQKLAVRKRIDEKERKREIAKLHQKVDLEKERRSEAEKTAERLKTLVEISFYDNCFTGLLALGAVAFLTMSSMAYFAKQQFLLFFLGLASQVILLLFTLKLIPNCMEVACNKIAYRMKSLRVTVADKAGTVQVLEVTDETLNS